MGVVVDTPIWSVYARRSANGAQDRTLLFALRDLVRRREVVLIGPVLQELLAGLRQPQQFDRLRRLMGVHVDEPMERFDFERAAEMTNQCLRVGIAGSSTDMLICAVAERLEAPVFTLDRDFERYRDILEIELYQP